MPRKQQRSKPAYRPLHSIDTPLVVDRFSHECRGITSYQGKTLFVRNALPGERVSVRLEKSYKRYDEADAIDITDFSSDRVPPACPHYNSCGGCDLQHLNPERAPEIKQQLVLDQLQRFADCTPVIVEAPIISAATSYRRSARIGINQRQRDGALLTGFRRRQSAKLMDIDHCPVLDPRLDQLFSILHAYLDDLSDLRHLTEVLVSLGDTGGALRFRLTRPASEQLKERLIAIAAQLQLSAWTEDNQQQLTQLSPSSELSFLANHQTRLHFLPGDFLQVNASVNRAMITRAQEWLNPKADQVLLDMFCGLGNFSLPLAPHLKQVIGVEGSLTMVERARQNAVRNGINNAEFYCADLSQPIKASTWFRQGQADLILLDPPRSGAAELLPQLLQLKPAKLLYIACNPAALARDAAVLLEAGYCLQRFSVLDMFPNTSHIESMALFERNT
ncbi:23S rRNA (uracil(1939)-C(5))-methyltransferase RlmD [Nitrincola iocasae]|uniref:23S rRNA (Uracil(1939)-C(5))-methyltransferase RlmD n=1 Tax=Nitrincola iocasae TaxID=2614693 RepID=A0A5J6LEV9_9GAMM|nr:23S rRNA (uracil(1939)-C(5))-methyltransferase RlmD [Nitrincola iocasae]QEW07174.1 23S rRNA (uracil(1939)-C(5))-methyltransferase RlmD [Nitrincola iocasae]